MTVVSQEPQLHLPISPTSSTSSPSSLLVHCVPQKSDGGVTFKRMLSPLGEVLETNIQLIVSSTFALKSAQTFVCTTQDT